MKMKIITALLAVSLILSACNSTSTSPTPSGMVTVSIAPSSTPIPPTAIPLPTTTLKEATVLFTGPGNVRYDALVYLNMGESIYPLAMYGDFTQVETTTGQIGFLRKSILNSQPENLPTLSADSVPLEPYWLPDCTPGYYNAVTKTVDYINTRDNFYVPLSGSLALNAPLHSWIDSASLDGEGDNASLLLFGHPETTSVWWQGIIRLSVIVYEGYYHIGIHDGTTEDYTLWALAPNEVSTNEPIQIIFDQIEGRTFRLLDSSGKEIANFDVTAEPNLHLPNGLFPNREVYIGVGLPPRTTLSINGMKIGVVPTGTWNLSAAPAPGLADLAAPHNIKIGTPFEIFEAMDVRDCQITKRDFNLVTLNDFTWSGVWLAPGEYDFSYLDSQMDVAEKHGWSIRAPIVWGVEELLPDWLRDGNYSRSEYITMLEDYEKSIISRYAGRVDEWVIANEAVSMKYLNADFWAKKIGPEYVGMAFRWAREADPDGVLIFNDYNNEEPRDAKSQRMVDGTYEMVKSLKEQGIPIDGVGLQFHLMGPYSSPIPPTKDGMLETMKKYGELGLKVYVTELDVDLQNHPGDDRLQFQANLYRDVFEACQESGVCPSVTMWGVSDLNTWLEDSCSYGWCGNQPDADPLLFDMEFLPKPAYFSVRNFLENK